MNWSDIKRIFESVIIESQHEYEFKEDRVSVSEAIQCLRKSFFGRKLRHEKQPVENLIDAFIGKSVHEAIQKRLKIDYQEALSVMCEVELENDVLIGHADLIIEIGEKRYIVELKTVKAAPLKPYLNHVLQVNAYLHMAKDAYNPESAFIVYIPKTRGTIRVYEVKPNIHTYNKTYDRAVVLLESLKNDRLPPAETTATCWFCQYYNLCTGRGGDYGKFELQERL